MTTKIRTSLFDYSYSLWLTYFKIKNEQKKCQNSIQKHISTEHKELKAMQKNSYKAMQNK